MGGRGDCGIVPDSDCAGFSDLAGVLWAFSVDDHVMSAAISTVATLNCWQPNASQGKARQGKAPSQLGAVTHGANCGAPDSQSQQGGRTHGGSSRSQRCVAGRVRRRPVGRRPRQSVAKTWRSVVRWSTSRGWWVEWRGPRRACCCGGGGEVVMVLSRARQGSEERDFGTNRMV